MCHVGDEYLYQLNYIICYCRLIPSLIAFTDTPQQWEGKVIVVMFVAVYTLQFT